MQPKSIGISVAFHVAVIIVATVSLPWLKRDFEIPQPLSVEFVEIDKITQTTKLAPKPVTKKEEPKKEEPPKPPPAPKNAASEPAKPVEPPKEEPKEEPKKEKPVLVDEAAPPEKKKTPKEEKKPETKKAEPKKSFDSVLKNLDLDDKTPPAKQEMPDLSPDASAPTESATNAPLGQRLTMSEEDALRRQLEGCWSVPLGAKDAENLRVEIYMVINEDRTLREARVVDQGRYNADPFFRAAADSAMRAVRNPLCSPFQVPPDKYDTWKTTIVTFDPSQMF